MLPEHWMTGGGQHGGFLYWRPIYVETDKNYNNFIFAESSGTENLNIFSRYLLLNPY